jgi:hypothetical protein
MAFYIKQTTIRTIDELMTKFKMLRSDSSTDFQRDYASHEFSRWLKDEGYNKVDNNCALSRFNDLEASIIVEAERVKFKLQKAKDTLIKEPNNWGIIGELNQIDTLLKEI